MTDLVDKVEIKRSVVDIMTKPFLGGVSGQGLVFGAVVMGCKLIGVAMSGSEQLRSEWKERVELVSSFRYSIPPRST